VIAYKLLASGSIGPFSRFPWPTPAADRPGPWVTAAANPVSVGIHATTAAEVRLWINDELWQIELDADVRREGATLVASSGRLVSRVEAWNDATKQRFIDLCAERIRRYAALSTAAAPFVDEVAEDARLQRPDLAAKDAEIAAYLAGGPSSQAEEQEEQSSWFIELLAPHR
jgi:hypothetical protein